MFIVTKFVVDKMDEPLIGYLSVSDLKFPQLMKEDCN